MDCMANLAGKLQNFSRIMYTLKDSNLEYILLLDRVNQILDKLKPFFRYQKSDSFWFYLCIQINFVRGSLACFLCMQKNHGRFP